MVAMGRKHRVDPPGTWHHITNHSVDSTPLYQDDNDRRRFTEILDQVAARYGIEVHTWCLMGNHYHLQVRSTQGRISDAMRDLNGRYARYYNRRHRRRGALFGSRFHSVVIITDEQQINTWTYIHRNPASLGIRDFTTYQWSSAAAYLRTRRPPAWLHTRFLAKLIAQRDMWSLVTHNSGPPLSTGATA